MSALVKSYNIYLQHAFIFSMYFYTYRWLECGCRSCTAVLMKSSWVKWCAKVWEAHWNCAWSCNGQNRPGVRVSTKHAPPPRWCLQTHTHINLHHLSSSPRYVTTTHTQFLVCMALLSSPSCSWEPSPPALPNSCTILRVWLSSSGGSSGSRAFR